MYCIEIVLQRSKSQTKLVIKVPLLMIGWSSNIIITINTIIMKIIRLLGCIVIPLLHYIQIWTAKLCYYVCFSLGKCGILSISTWDQKQSWNCGNVSNFGMKSQLRHRHFTLASTLFWGFSPLGLHKSSKAKNS